jgi:hypothetical protein
MRPHLAHCKHPAHSGSSGGRSTPRIQRFDPQQLVVVRTAQLDAQGRVLVEAGARGRILEELDTVPGWWLVAYEATTQCWPTHGEDLRPAHLRMSGRLDEQALQQVIRLFLHTLHEHGVRAEGAEPEEQVREVLEYLHGRAGAPQVVEDLIADRPARCRCGDSGVCMRCDGRGGRCRTCKGTRICRDCPRLAQPAEVAAPARVSKVA